MKSKNHNTFITMGFRIDSSQEERFSEDFEQALIEIMYIAEEDGRVLSILLTWAQVHSKHIIVEKLAKVYSQFIKYRRETIIFSIFAIECFSNGDHRFKKLIKMNEVPIYFPDRKSTKSSVNLKGTYETFEKFNILIPNGSIRYRNSDVLDRRDLVSKNPQVKNRFLFGSNWRSDIIFKIQNGASSPSEISRELGCSYEPANRIWKEYQIAMSC